MVSCGLSSVVPQHLPTDTSWDRAFLGSGGGTHDAPSPQPTVWMAWAMQTGYYETPRKSRCSLGGIASAGGGKGILRGEGRLGARSPSSLV